MTYTIYIAENCHECQAVLETLKGNNIELEIRNVDLEAVETPIPVFAFPALFRGNTLLRYGSDIIEFFLEKGQKKSR